MKKLLLWCFSVVCLPCLIKAQSGLISSIWDVPGIYNVPPYKIVSSDSVMGLIYEGLPYQEHMQQIFAWYATPGILYGDKSLDRNLPAVVLVHGGGGKAFKEWAIMWARKGYAAIALDLRGNGPEGKHIENGFLEENGETPYFTITLKLSDQWLYQAVSDVLLAHNLVRHFAEVDSSRTAITGISWGGVITCIVAGLDNRFKVAVPVYGCGYLWQSGRMEQQLNQLSAVDRAIWIKQYDPSHYVRKAEMPILFLNDANDPYFTLPSYMKTYKEAKRKNLCIKTDLKHSHRAGWSNDEIYSFINSYINKTPSLAVISDPVKKEYQIRAQINSQVSVIKAFLNYTTEPADAVSRKWNIIEVSIEKDFIIVPVVPKGTTMWYLSLIDESRLKVSGEIQFVRKD